MLSLIRENPRAFALAFVIHVIAIGALALHVDWWSPSETPPKIIQATIIDESKIKAEQEKVRAAEDRKRREEEERQREQREREAQRQREIEQQRLAEQKREAEKKRKAEDELKRKQAETKRQEDAKKRAAEEQRLAEAEKNRKLESEKQRKLEEDRQRKAEEAKRKAEQEERRKEAERALQEQLAAEAAEEEAREQAARQRQKQSEIDKYKGLIQQAIENRWLRPAEWPSGTSCVVEVRLVPGAGGGQVIDARVVRSCGNPLFNKSVETAVFGASPLPLPRDPSLWGEFRALNITFRPK